MLQNKFTTTEQVPLFPHERALIEKRIQDYTAQQAELGKLLGEAMDQSSETWHDNAPAEAISDASRSLAERAEYFIRLRSSATTQAYPTVKQKSVVLGSTVRFLLNGVSQELTIISELSLYSGNGFISYKSPLGKLLLGKKIGDSFVALIAGKEKNIEIVDIDQLRLEQQFTS